MRLSHFETLNPVCPRCRGERGLLSPLKLATIVTRENENIIQGVLHCSDIECQMEYPIIDGIPVIVPNIRSYLSDNLYHITAREDLSDTIESILGDAAGPNTFFDATRQHLSSYCWSHYNDIDSNRSESGHENTQNSLLNCLNTGLGLLDKTSFSPILDVGCSVGRTSFELAENYQGLVLGIDLNFSMLRLAHSILHKGKLRYPLRRVGIVYDYIEQNNLSFPNSDKVDFWCCNALSLPFKDNSFELATSLNVLDAVSSPFELLQNIYRILKPESDALFITPFDWSTSATALEAWVGGHSQRGENKGSSEMMLRSLLTSDKNSKLYTGLKLQKEINELPWILRVHDRHSAHYKVFVTTAKTKKETFGDTTLL